ncbi:hypothetical protein EMCRGX_G008282 [Ephydatia muelleri]
MEAQNKSEPTHRKSSSTNMPKTIHPLLASEIPQEERKRECLLPSQGEETSSGDNPSPPDAPSNPSSLPARESATHWTVCVNRDNPSPPDDPSKPPSFLLPAKESATTALKNLSHVIFDLPLFE